MRSLREIVHVYSVPASDVVRTVNEEFRHLDTTVVLCLLKARADSSGASSGSRSGANGSHVHWTKEIAAHYKFFRWGEDCLLPWETRRGSMQMSVMAFSEVVTAGPSAVTLGPSTLRKTGANMADLVVRSGMSRDDSGAISQFVPLRPQSVLNGVSSAFSPDRPNEAAAAAGTGTGAGAASTASAGQTVLPTPGALNRQGSQNLSETASTSSASTSYTASATPSRPSITASTASSPIPRPVSAALSAPSPSPQPALQRSLLRTNSAQSMMSVASTSSSAPVKGKSLFGKVSAMFGGAH